VGTAPHQDATKTYKSRFKRALKKVDVPAVLEQGISVIRVYANGEKPKKQYLTLSRDKFTIHITSKPIVNSKKGSSDEEKPLSWKRLFRKCTSQDNGESEDSSAEWSRKKANKEVRTIDIGAIHRIQRGAHNANLRNTTDSTMPYRTRRSRSDARTRISSPLNISGHNPFNDSNASAMTFAESSSTLQHSFEITDPNHLSAAINFKNPDYVSDVQNNSSTNWGRLWGSTTNETATSPGGKEPTKLDPGKCFSIIFRGDWTLDLMINDFDIMSTKTSAMRDGNDDSSHSSVSKITRDEMLDALDDVIKAYKQAKQQVSNDVSLLRYVWIEADQDKSNTIAQNEIGGVFNRINYPIKKSDLNHFYDSFCRTIGLSKKDRKNGLTFEQTCTLLHKIKRDVWKVRPFHQYWNTLFGEYMKNGKQRKDVSSKTFLKKFLHEYQGELGATLKDVNELFRRLNAIELPHVAGEEFDKDPTRIDKNRFEVYLLEERNDAFDPEKEASRDESMHRPLSEYWINSSHNTYLTGDQFTSNSSIDMYSNALYRGCKCLELDIWDGGYDAHNEPVPVVWHGHTMTSKILYRDIIKAIKLYVNFHPDTFPLILSYENHCSIPFQQVMAEQLTEILGDSLYIPKEDSLGGELPSPFQLRGMVVIKGRRPEKLGIDDDGNHSDDGAPSTIAASDVYSQSYTGQSSPSQQNLLPPHQKATSKVCSALARLTLFHGTKYVSWDDSLSNPNHFMHSFTESKIKSLYRKTNRMKWVIYNESHMSRSYPAGSRVDSSNYSPLLAWAMGTQLVALNFQTVDAPLLLNDGRFRQNGGCGYVLKSSKLIDHQQPPNEFNHIPTQLSVRVLSGSCLPKPNDWRKEDLINPYVKVSVHDVKNGDKESVTTSQTSPVPDGFDPIWNERKFEFRIENLETAMLQLCVYTGSYKGFEVLIGSSSIPISCLRKGLRSVKIFDPSNTRSGAFDFASLLIDVELAKVKGTASAAESTMAEI